MENITITLDEETLAWARAHAAEQSLSLSGLLGQLINEKRSQEYEAAMRLYFSIRPRNINDGEPYPRRDELYDRKVFRQ